MLQHGPIFHNQNLRYVVGASRKGKIVDPGDRLKLRLLTVRHRDRLGVEPLTAEVIGAILDEYIRDLQGAAA